MGQNFGQGVYQVLEGLSLLASHHEEILEMDINPFMALPKGKQSCAVDVRIRL